MVPPVSLNALRAFTEVGRLGSVKHAASLLGVTPGAVSQQIKALEKRIDVVLFERYNRELRLTADGSRLFGFLSGAFVQIDAAVSNFHTRRPHRETLTISTTASFAATWLVPRLGSFQSRYPEIEVRLDTQLRTVELKREAVDIALRHGSGNYPGLESIPLLTPVLIPVGSPTFLQKISPIHKPGDCLEHSLLQDRDRADWPEWCRVYGIKQASARAATGFSFENDLLLIRAAIANQGLALVRDIYAEEDLRAGRIVVAIPAPMQTDAAYYFVARPEAMQMHKFVAFRNWIVAEACSRP